MIKAVLFDFGGVLSMGGKSARANMKRFLAERLGIDQSGVQLDDLHDGLRRGKITTEEFLDEIHRRHPLEQRLTIEELLDDAEFLTRADEVYELADRLRRAGIRTGILSNIYEISAHKLKQDGFYDNFDPLILSFEEKSAKPDIEIYKSSIDKVGLKPQEILFIDDQEVNLPVASELGMRVVLARNPKQIVKDSVALVEKENRIKL